ncbi:hypothetical protein [Alcanivorax jadensis]|uniref:hypothetical protein n=1 Tax=Alcanivorax jadensis TaxID=64988 RepID=UPI0011889254|nr:hypothetical protein [Alcanivorax jadensis]QDP60320.1 MAG: hypothetical protein Tp1122MES720101_26 [Prokaryotic dsDNA virus sp.]|tara:strand:- start:21991 stop:22860 length:870 start_codon:yes stop_codon:yes gene_type:complete
MKELLQAGVPVPIAIKAAKLSGNVGTADVQHMIRRQSEALTLMTMILDDVRRLYPSLNAGLDLIIQQTIDNAGMADEAAEMELSQRMKLADELERETWGADNDWKAWQETLEYVRDQQWRPSGIEYDRTIHHNPDGKSWADLFLQTFPHCGADPETMHGWFANAMMAMYDHLKNSQPAQQGSVPEEWREVLAGCVTCFNCPEWSDKCEKYERRARELLSTPTTTQADGWISMADREPTKSDEDCEGKIWLLWPDRRYFERVNRGHVSCSPEFFWMPTGLKRPQPPKEGE